MKAKIVGGPFDGREIELQEPKLELLLDDTSSGRLVTLRYVLHFTDKRGVGHYYLPTDRGGAPR